MSMDIVIGMGEVGGAIHSILSERRTVVPWDPAKLGEDQQVKAQLESSEIDWCHVCIPYTHSFVSTIVEYAKRFEPKHLVLHSTLPIGTTRKVEREADYIPTFFSPIRGRHPNLASAIRAFPKIYASSIPGGMDSDFEGYFANAGIQTRKAPSFEVAELMKIWETTSFAVQLIMWAEIESEMKRLPGDHHANMTAMKNWLFEKRRVYDGDIGLCPVLDLAPGRLGGHCLRNNILLGKEYFHSSLYEWLTTVDDSRESD